MNRITVTLLLLLGITSLSYAQIVKDSSFSYQYDYETILLDSTYDSSLNPELSKYLAKKRNKLNKVMQVVIGQCDKTLDFYSPASPLSNFLTDILLHNSPSYCSDTDFRKCDVALLNFGGIRAPLGAGEITVGDLYDVIPFDNYVVFATLKGSELKKALMRFTDKKCEPCSGVQMTYRNGKPVSIIMDGQPIDETKIYRLVTLNFILEGGDGILGGIQFEKISYSTTLFRDFLIEEIKKMTLKEQTVQSGLDQRVIIKADL